VQITVVGAGVIGLTVAVELARAGHAVRVIAERVLDATTSAIAGAVWFPYRVGPRERVAAWAARTRARLLELAAREPAAGVDALVGYECDDRAAIDRVRSAAKPGPNVLTARESPWDDGEALPWWAAQGGVERAPAPVAGAPPAWRFVAPRVEPARHLPWLTAQLATPVEVARVDDLAAVPGDVVIHCAGLGARSLAADPSVVALKGQVVIVERGDLPADITFTDDRGAEPIFYAIPRRDEVVLGGSSEPAEPDDRLAPDPAVTDRILARCHALGWTPGPVRRVRVGLRPYRPAVRLERDPDRPRVIHCYGHGGAGYTLAAGCAEEIVRLL
jgi:D-amino-acid oxidase